MTSTDRSGHPAYTNQKFLVMELWDKFFKRKADELAPGYDNTAIRTELNNHFFDGVEAISFIKHWYNEAQWYGKFNLLEFIIQQPYVYANVTEINEVLKREFSAYRIVDNTIVEITDEEEVKEIEASLSISDQFAHVKAHLKRALKDLADREHPAYRNSIKESISAVEAICKTITGNGSGTLGKALEELERNHNLHPSLKTAFSKLYGYTSDAGGIRHALSDDSIEPGQEEARFMLITCSAFVNYLVQKVAAGR